MSDVYIVGVDMIKFGRFPDRTVPSLAAEAALMALDDAGRLIDEGVTALGGKVPVNVSGGLLSKGHPLGATGIANIYEVATHLRGTAGQRQVEGARLGLTHVVGGGPGMGTACAIHILEKA